MKQHKKFVLYTVGISVFIIFAHLIVMETFARNVLVPNDTVHMKEKLILDRKEEITIIGLGDSHVGNDLYLRENGFNLGRGGDTTPIMYFKLKWLIENDVNVEHLLLQMDYHIFSYYRTQPGNHVKNYYHIIDEPVDSELGDYPSANTFFGDNFIFYSLLDVYSPIIHKTFLNYLKGDFTKPDVSYNGQLSTDYDWTVLDEEDRIASAESRTAGTLYNQYLISEKLVHYYEKIIELAQQNNIKVTLIRYPLANEYLDLVNEEVETEFNELLSRIENKYNLKTLDYRYIFQEKQNYFIDQDHLNNTGAKELGKVIESEL
ncbi:DUF1574 family protein [Sutcliffiella deserti]|uniref:DUF1574 family protein n=1 Tax=Sutcliffiella deserti TaxID=2875501 RepID=UPI001CC1B268|nr:DUF1574 family protein [Sutcliffiella deserti]